MIMGNKKALGRALISIGLLCFFNCRIAWASDEEWVKCAEEFQEKTWWREVALGLAAESYYLGAFHAGGQFGSRMIESDALSYSAIGLLAVFVVIPGSLRENCKEKHDLEKHEEKGVWKGIKEDFRRINLLSKRVTAPHDLKGIFFMQPLGMGAGVSNPAKLVDVTTERINAAGITLSSPLDDYLDQREGSIGMRYGLAKNILIGTDIGVSESDIHFSRVIRTDGSIMGQMRYRLRTFSIDAMAEWRIPVDFKKFNFFVGAGPTYSHTSFTEAFSWRGNTTWSGSAFGGKAGVRAEWYVFKHSSMSFNLIERFNKVSRIKTGTGDMLRNNAGEIVPVDLASVVFTVGLNHRF